MNDTPREMVWTVEPKPKKTNQSSALKKEMNDLKKEFNKLSQFLIQNLVDMEGELALLKQENEQLKSKVKTFETAPLPVASFLPTCQLPVLDTAFLM